MNIIFYQTKTKFNNSGDALINRALINYLRVYGKILANSSDNIPTEFIRELDLREEERFKTKKEIDFFWKIVKYAMKHRGDNVYIVSGLGDVHGGSFKRVVKIYASTAMGLVYKLIGAKTIRIGRSYGDITHSMETAERIRSVFTAYNYVRDTVSLEKCRIMGMKNIQFCPDMSWIYLRGTERLENNSSVVSVFMRGATLQAYDVDYVERMLPSMDVMIDTIAECFKGEIHLIFAYQVQEDEKITKLLYDRYKDKYQSEMIGRMLKLSDVQSVYGKSSIHISNRMHSLLLGYKYGSMPLGLVDVNKHIKIRSTFADCDLQELIFDIDGMRYETERLRECIKNKSHLLEKLFSVENDMQNRVDSEIEKIF